MCFEVVTYILISLNHLVTNRTLTFDLLFFYFFRNRLLSRLLTYMFVFKPVRYHFITIHTLNAFHHFILITFKSKFRTIIFDLLFFCYFMNQLLCRPETNMFVFEPARYNFFTIHTFNSFNYFI